MSEVQVWYTVPVACHVDADTGKVTRVVVIDESIALDAEEGVTLSDYSDAAPTWTGIAAVVAAETEEWPPWEYGY